MLEVIFYIVLCLVLATQQCIVLEIIKYIKHIFARYGFHYFALIIVVILLLFINFYISSLIIALFIYTVGAIDNFDTALQFALDSFSTLGSTQTLDAPWRFL